MDDSNNTQATATTCARCGKSPDELKRCAKCQSVRYCNRDCQKADWKTHKKVCASLAGGASTSSNSTSKNLDVAIPNPFTRLTQGTWLHGRSERDTYKLLIDAYRLRMKDDCNLLGEVDEDCVMGGAPSSAAAFARFLQRLNRVAPKLLPPWWSAEKGEECRRAGMRGGADVWESLSAAPEKADFIEHYGDSRMPMQLRMFAEAVYGSGPGGQDGKDMMEMMARSEGGGSLMSMIDVSSLFGGLGGRR